MQYFPIKDEKEAQHWIDWLQEQAELLDGKNEDVSDNLIFGTQTGDIATAKQMVGIFLATFTDKTVEIR